MSTFGLPGHYGTDALWDPAGCSVEIRITGASRDRGACPARRTATPLRGENVGCDATELELRLLIGDPSGGAAFPQTSERGRVPGIEVAFAPVETIRTTEPDFTPGGRGDHTPRLPLPYLPLPTRPLPLRDTAPPRERERGRCIGSRSSWGDNLVAQDSTGGQRRHRRSGAGTVRRLPSGRWQARRTEADGTMVSLGSYRTKADAEHALVLAEADELRGQRQLDSAGTVAEWAQRWLDRSVHWKPSTRAGNEQMLRARTLPRWGTVELAAIARRDVETWVAELVAAGAQPDVLRRALEPLRAICRLAIEEGALGADPTTRVRLPRQPKRALTVLTVAQVEALAHEIEHPVYRPAGHGARAAAPSHRPDLALAVRLAAYGGPRAGELWALRRRSVDLAGPALLVTESVTEVRGKLVVTPPKTGMSRRVPLPDELREPLAAQLATRPEDPAAWLFVGQTGELVRHLAVYRRHFRPAAARAGVPGTRWHDLRHACASLLIAEGGHPKAVMERLGHSSITVTLDRYGHLFPALDDALTAGLNERIRTATADQSGTRLARPEAGEATNSL